MTLWPSSCLPSHSFFALSCSHLLLPLIDRIVPAAIYLPVGVAWCCLVLADCSTRCLVVFVFIVVLEPRTFDTMSLWLIALGVLVCQVVCWLSCFGITVCSSRLHCAVVVGIRGIPAGLLRWQQQCLHHRASVLHHRRSRWYQGAPRVSHAFRSTNQVSEHRCSCILRTRPY
jgi:hypothetical protein